MSAEYFHIPRGNAAKVVIRVIDRSSGILDRKQGVEGTPRRGRPEKHGRPSRSCRKAPTQGGPGRASNPGPNCGLGSVTARLTNGITWRGCWRCPGGWGWTSSWTYPCCPCQITSTYRRCCGLAARLATLLCSLGGAHCVLATATSDQRHLSDGRRLTDGGSTAAPRGAGAGTNQTRVASVLERKRFI